MTGPSIEPMYSGILELPARAWKLGDTVHLKFYQSDRFKTDRLVDAYNLTIGEKTFHFKEAQGTAPAITEDAAGITLTGENFSLSFDKATGMIRQGIYKGETVLTGGPYLNMGVTSVLDAWTLTNISSTRTDNEAIVNIAGKYGNTGVVFVLHVDGTGLITTTYQISHLPSAYDAIGVAYDVSAQADRITWQRNGQWSYYPEDQIGRNEGTAVRTRNGGTELYGVRPTWAWSQDEKNFNAYGKDDPGQRGTTDFFASKNNFNVAALSFGASGKRLTIQGDGQGAVKGTVLPDGNVRISIHNIWSHPAAFPGWIEANSVSKPISLADTYTNRISMRLGEQDEYSISYYDVPTYLSDLNWASAAAEWREPKKNSSIQGDVLTLFDGMGSKSFKHGIGTHAKSEIVYDLSGKGYETFESYVGVDQESTQGTVIFQVWVDEEKRFDSGKMGPRTAAQKVSVNIAGKRELRLVVTDSGDGIMSDHADWADAKLIKLDVVVAPSTEARLQEIFVNGQSLAEFAQDKFSYNVTLPAGTKVVPTVTATTVDTSAVAKITPASALPGTTTIEVKAEDGVSTRTYTIHFTVKSATTDPGDSNSDPSGSSSGGGRGTTMAGPTKPSIAQQMVEKLVVTNGEAIVSVQEGIQEVLIPVASDELKRLSKLVIQGGDISVDLPNAVIAQLIGLATKGQKSYVAFKFTKLSVTDAEQRLKKVGSAAHAAIKATGSIYELSLGVTHPDGAFTPLTVFDKPIVLKLKVHESARQELTGLYQMKDNGELVYVKGHLVNGMIEAPIHHFSAYGILNFEKTFVDVPDQHFASQVIKRMVARQVINGVNETAFAPELPVTRAAFVTMLVRALDLPSASGTVPFTDVRQDAWYASAVEAAYKAGILTGRSQTRFAPEGTMTREEMAVMIIRAYEVKRGEKVDTSTKQSQFTDDKQMSVWARTSIQVAFDLGLLHGRGSNQFAPQGVTTRAESVQVIANVLDLL